MTHEELIGKIIEAKEKFGEKAIPILVNYYHVENFDEEKKSGLCPFHKEKTPSFKWNPKDLSFKCFACGRRASILDMYIETEGSYVKAVKKLCDETGVSISMGFSSPDRDSFFLNYRFPEPETNSSRETVDAYAGKRGISARTLDYAGVKQDKQGNMVFELYDTDNRLLCKKYRPCHHVKHGQAKMWWDKNSDNCAVLYNINKVDITRPLVVVEGYIDALSVIESGYTNVVSIPGGAEDTNWIEFNYDFLEHIDDVILWFDNDRAGQEGISKVISRLGEYRCRIVKPSKEDEDDVEKYYKGFNANITIRKTDANNILLACGKERILSLVNGAERIPSKNLKLLMDCATENIAEQEKFSFGIDALDRILYGNLFSCFTIYSGKSGCVDCDTEYFDGTKWKKISEYRAGDKVLVYDKSGHAKLEIPVHYHKYSCDKLYHFSTKYGLDQCISEEHNVYYVDSNKKLCHKSAREVFELHEKSPNGFEGEFITFNENWECTLVKMENGDGKVPIEEYEPVDGYKYCFTTSTGMWIMRRNNCIVVTGNSGKSSITNVTSLISPVECGYKTFSFSGELADGQLADWVVTNLAGCNHVMKIPGVIKDGAPFYVTTKEAEEKIREFYKSKMILYSDDDGLDVSGDALIRGMEEAYKRYGCRVFNVDNLMTVSFDEKDEDKWMSQKKFIIKLMGFAKKYNACVNLVVHPKKMSREQTEVSTFDLHGASEIGNLCHRMIWVDKLNEDVDGYNTKITIVKDRPTGKAGRSCKLFYDDKTRRFYDSREELTKQYSWEKSCKINYPPDVAKDLAITEVPKNLATDDVSYNPEDAPF
jgi:5S rRNA maturation endonuclease (ribonuclease M5)